MRIENKRIRLEFNEPGVHPFVSLQLPDGGGSWEQAVLLGARQLKYFHKGASFPRLVCDGEEQEAGAQLEMAGGADGGEATISDIRGGFEITTRIDLSSDSPVVHVAHVLRAQGDVRLNRVFDRFDFVAAPGAECGKELDYSFVPHLRPKANMVIGDHVFRSPVIITERDSVFFALIPDLMMLSDAYRDGPARYYLDFLVTGGENHCPAACFGAGRTRPAGHVYFEKQFQRGIQVSKGGSVTLGYYLVVDRGGLGSEQVLSLLWEQFGRRLVREGLPQVVSFDRYASAGLGRMFKRRDLFKSFELEGQPCGGTVGIHLANRRGVRLMDGHELRRYLRIQDVALAVQRVALERLMVNPLGGRFTERLIYRHGPKVPPQIFLQSWFNNLRSAYGAYWFGRKWHDRELVESALAVKNLAILAPREQGAFPAVCYVTDEGIYWSRGTRAFKHVDSYHTADCATTAYYMALWFRDHEGDPRLLWQCREFADFLLKVQLPSGAFPAWVRPEGKTLVASTELKESATTACPAMFLALLYQLDGNERYLEAARRAADFLVSEVIPSQKWFDYETFFSCSSKRLGLFDAYTGTFPQNTMSMYWAAEAFRLLHLATGERRYLDTGVEVLDHLCLYQQVWDPPFLSINAFGGFGVMNTDGEWNDSRQALFAPVLMDYYTLTGRPEHMERGIAALRASFTCMFLDENRRVAPGNMRLATREETGSVAENYGHFGYDRPTLGYLQSDWGPGSACQAAAYAQAHFGDIFVDAGRKRAFGINGCRVDRMRGSGNVIELDVEKQVDAGLEVVIKVVGEVPPGLGIEVNGVPAQSTPAGDFRALL